MAAFGLPVASGNWPTSPVVKTMVFAPTPTRALMPASAWVVLNVAAADAYLNKIARRDLGSRTDELHPLLRKTGKPRGNRVGGSGLGAADGKVVLRNTQQCRRRIDEIRAAAKPAGR